MFFSKLLVDDDGEVTEIEWSDTYEPLRAPDLPKRIDAELAALEKAADPDLLFAGQGSSDGHQGSLMGRYSNLELRREIAFLHRALHGHR